MDTEIGCFMKLEVGHAETEIQSRVQDRGGQAYQGTRGVGGASASGLRIRVICALRREIAAGISRHVGKDFAESNQPDLFVAAAAG
jgi:hypothetical protein